MKYGAVDYLNKPFDVEELKNLIAVAIERTSGVRQIIKPASPSQHPQSRRGLRSDCRAVRPNA